ncbi:MAG TPA: hypothetical protein VFR71_01795, partial [Methyloceanibacter sp.]|nr:hypothetical protein [Methyloceanibacter sp.]
LRRDGIMVLVGLPEQTPLSAGPLIMKRRSLAGSLIGGIRETQEMLDFCAAHGVAADVEVIPIQEINQAYERMLNNDVRYRFVIDLASLKIGCSLAARVARPPAVLLHRESGGRPDSLPPPPR